MSTQLYFSSRSGLLSRDDKKPKPIQKSLEELDLLLYGDEEKQSSGVDQADEDKSTGTPTSVASFPIQEHQNACVEKFLTEQPRIAVQSRSTRTIPTSPAEHREYEDSKSVSSSTILSRDISMISLELIANMDRVQDTESDCDIWAASSRTIMSPRSKSCSSSRRAKRGESLERDICRTVLEQTPAILRCVEETDFKSAEEILEDLMTTMLSSHCSESNPNTQPKNLHPSIKTDLRETASCLDEDKDFGDAPFDESLDTSKFIHDIALLTDEKGFPTELLQTDACDANHEGIVEVGEDVFDGVISMKSGDFPDEGKSSENETSIYSAGMIDFSTETIPEKSDCSLVESLAASSQILVAPLMQLHLHTYPEDQSCEIFDTKNQAHLPLQQVETKCEVLHTDLQVLDDNSTIDNDWTNFGGNSAFGDSFSPGKHESSQAFATPTETKQPESPKNISDL